VRTAAIAALAVIGDPASVILLAEVAASDTATEAERTAARSTLDQMRGEAVDKAIVAALGSAQGKVKVELIRPAGERGITSSVGVLLEAARSEDIAVKRAAVRALRDTVGPEQISDLIALLTGAIGEADRREVERALASALRKSPPPKGSLVVEAYRSAARPEVKASLLQVMGQAGTAEVLPTLREALAGSEADVVRASILALTEWPTEEPLSDLLAFSGRTQNPAHQVLSQRAVLKLLDLPSKRPAAESVKILSTLMGHARQTEEKRSVLALVVRFPTKEALTVAEAAANDPSVTVEAKAAIQRLRRSLGMAP
jgi:HEAT repeat protein